MSVVIPAYNAQSFVNESIHSCLGQKHRPLEIIVVDDGSTDLTASRATNLRVTSGSKDADLRVIRLERNHGAANALHIGFKEARGDFVCWLSADDLFVDSLKITRQVKEMLEDGSGWSFYNGFLVGSTIQAVRKVHSKYMNGLLSPDAFLDELFVRDPDYRLMMLLFSNPVNGSTVMTRKETIDRFGQFDPATKNIDGDGDLWMRYTALRLNPSLLMGRPLLYREHAGQTSKNRKAMALGLELTRMRILKEIDSHGRLTPLLKKTSLMFCLAILAGGYRERPLVAEYLFHHVLSNSEHFGRVMTSIAKRYLRLARAAGVLLAGDRSGFDAHLEVLYRSDEFTRFRALYGELS